MDGLYTFRFDLLFWAPGSGAMKYLPCLFTWVSHMADVMACRTWHRTLDISNQSIKSHTRTLHKLIHAPENRMHMIHLLPTTVNRACNELVHCIHPLNAAAVSNVNMIKGYPIKKILGVPDLKTFDLLHYISSFLVHILINLTVMQVTRHQIAGISHYIMTDWPSPYTLYYPKYETMLRIPVAHENLVSLI